MSTFRHSKLTHRYFVTEHTFGWVLRRVFALFVIAVAVFLVAPDAASAHPLGNFTVNRYARIEPSAGVVRVTYVLDQAEIPTFQEQKQIDVDPRAFGEKRADAILTNLHLTVDGAPLALRRTETQLTQPNGQGGLPTLRLSIHYEATAPQAGTLHHATFKDDNEPDRIGWREIVVAPQGNALVQHSDKPLTDVTNELQQYPKSAVQAPLDQRQASFDFDPGTAIVAAAPFKNPTTVTVRDGNSFSALIGRDHLGIIGILTLFVTAVVFGMGHALAPGHGKSIMAAYLVGTRGRSRDAIALGVTVAIMHTLSVLVLGATLLWLTSTADLSKLYPIITLLSGATVIAVGVAMVVRRVRQHRHAQAHAHHHTHAHAHDHGHGHTHDLPNDVAPLSRRGLYMLATSGGLLPSPSAVIVLIAAVSLHRLALGLAIIAAFSAGLAVTLTVIGLALVQGRSLLDRKNLLRPSAIRLAPILSACALIAVGSVVSVEGLSGL